MALGWLPREANQPADDLSNGVVTGFDPELRVPVSCTELAFLVMPRMLTLGQEFLQELQEGRAARRSEAALGGIGQRERKRARGGLRDRDPW